MSALGKTPLTAVYPRRPSSQATISAVDDEPPAGVLSRVYREFRIHDVRRDCRGPAPGIRRSVSTHSLRSSFADGREFDADDARERASRAKLETTDYVEHTLVARQLDGGRVEAL